MLLTDVVLGLINVTDKQLNVFNLSMSIKSLLAIIFLIISINYSIPYYLQHIYRGDQRIHQVVEGMQ